MDWKYKVWRVYFRVGILVFILCSWFGTPKFLKPFLDTGIGIFWVIVATSILLSGPEILDQLKQLVRHRH